MRRTIFDHTPDGLRQRLADMERQIADLQKVRNPPATYVEQAAAEGGGGQCLEAFSFEASFSLTTGTYADPCPFTALLTGTADQFYTSGITGVPSSGTFTGISVPGGLWVFGLHGSLDASAAPSSGRVLGGFNLTTAGAYRGYETSVPWHAFTTNSSNVATMQGEKMVYDPEPFDASVYISNFLNVTVASTHTLPVLWTGRQIAACDLTVPA